MHHGMIFVDSLYKESVIRDTVAIMIDLDALKNINSLKNIIFGYDDKNDTYKSWHGMHTNNMYLKNKNSSMFITDKITSHMTEIHIVGENTLSSNSKKMSFYKDETYSNVRVYINEYIMHILDILSIVTMNIVDFKYITDMIIYEWIDNVAKNKLNNINMNYNIDNINDINFSKNYRYHWLPIMDKLWDRMKYVSRTKGLKISDSFTYAVISFIESRYEIANNMK